MFSHYVRHAFVKKSESKEKKSKTIWRMKEYSLFLQRDCKL